jgi:GNAT superfamily N-acetyltransferase
MKTNSNIATRRVQSDAELQHYIDTLTSIRPEWITSVEKSRAEDAALPKTCQQLRFLTEQDGETVATGNLISTYWGSDPTHFQFWPLAKEKLSREAADTHMDFALEVAKEFGASKVNTWIPAHNTTFVETCEDRQFHLDQANPESILMLEDLDKSSFQPAIDALYASGLRVLSLEELLQEDPERGWERYHELDVRLTQDVPLPYEFVGEPIDTFRESFLIHKKSFPTIQIVADGDHLVATSMLFVNLVDDRFYSTGLTGVDREYRRRGIAKAIKAINFQRAKAAGGKQILCDNEENNPMLQLNYQLGFKPHWVWNSYSVELS